MEAALAFVPIAVILAVHTHSFIFTRTLCHPVFNLEKDGVITKTHGAAPSSLESRCPGSNPLFIQDPGVQAISSHIPETQTLTSSGSREYFSGSLLAISSSFLETQTWLLPRQKAWQGRQVPPPTAEPTNSGRHCSQWLPWKPKIERSEGLQNHRARDRRAQHLVWTVPACPPLCPCLHRLTSSPTS